MGMCIVAKRLALALFRLTAAATENISNVIGLLATTHAYLSPQLQELTPQAA